MHACTLKDSPLFYSCDVPISLWSGSNLRQGRASMTVLGINMWPQCIWYSLTLYWCSNSFFFFCPVHSFMLTQAIKQHKNKNWRKNRYKNKSQEDIGKNYIAFSNHRKRHFLKGVALHFVNVLIKLCFCLFFCLFFFPKSDIRGECTLKNNSRDHYHHLIQYIVSR